MITASLLFCCACQTVKNLTDSPQNKDESPQSQKDLIYLNPTEIQDARDQIDKFLNEK